MDIDKCCETLDVNKSASPEQVKQAYRDLVNIWHPDRVPDNPRLKKKAEDKLKDINAAYETLNAHLLAQKSQEPKNDLKTKSYPETAQEAPSRNQAQTNVRNSRPGSQAVEDAEGVVKQDWSPFSNLWSSIVSAFRQMVAERPPRMHRDDVDPLRSPKGAGMGGGRGRCMRGMGRGRGFGPGRGGMGRGRGR